MKDGGISSGRERLEEQERSSAEAFLMVTNEIGALTGSEGALHPEAQRHVERAAKRKLADLAAMAPDMPLPSPPEASGQDGGDGLCRLLHAQSLWIVTIFSGLADDGGDRPRVGAGRCGPGGRASGDAGVRSIGRDAIDRDVGPGASRR